MSLTMALVEVHTSANRVMIEQARARMAPASTIDIPQSRYRFRQMLSGVSLAPEHTATIEEELEATAESPERTSAAELAHLWCAERASRSRVVVDAAAASGLAQQCTAARSNYSPDIR